MPVLYKSDGTVEFDTVTKASEDLGELTAIVYPVERSDSDEHVASAEVIRDMAHAFQKEGGQIDIRHDGRPVGKDRAYVAESFLVQKGDPRFEGLKDYDGEPVDAAGSWATVIRVDDPQLREMYRKGEWNGVSMAGTGVLTVEKGADDEAPGWFAKAITTALRAVGLGGVSNDDEIEMKKEELVDVLKEQFQALAEALKPAAPAKEEPVKKADEAAPPAAQVDANDPAALRARAAELEKAQAPKVDLNDPAALRARAAELEKADEGDDSGADDGASAEVKRLRKALREAEGRTNQPNASSDNEIPEGLTKEDVEGFAIGDRMAEWINKQLA